MSGNNPFGQSVNPLGTAPGAGPMASMPGPAFPPPSGKFGPPPAPRSSSGCGWIVAALILGAGCLGSVVIAGAAFLWSFAAHHSAEFHEDLQRIEMLPTPSEPTSPGSNFPPPMGPPLEGRGLPGVGPFGANPFQPGSGTPKLEPFPALAAPTVALPVTRFAEQDLFLLSAATDRLGAPSFDERAPQGGVLVGLRLQKSMNWGGAICGVQAIYQVGDRYELGKAFGGTGAVEQREFLAQPGFAVSALRTRVGLVMNAVQIRFSRVRGASGLDLQEAYETEWYGCDGGGEQPPADGRGSFLAGLTGVEQGDLRSLNAYAGATLPDVVAPFPPLVARGDVTRIEAGSKSGQEYEDRAAPGGVLVGFRVFKGTNWGGAVRAVQPIYQIRDQYVTGRRCGLPGGELNVLLAPPGYAVGKFEVDIGLVLDGFQLTYQRLRPDGTLDPQDSRASDYVGVRGGQVHRFGSNNLPLGGVLGNWQEDLYRLGGIVVRCEAGTAEAEAPAQP